MFRNDSVLVLEQAMRRSSASDDLTEDAVTHRRGLRPPDVNASITSVIQGEFRLRPAPLGGG